MRTASFFILVYVAIGIQLGLSGVATIKGVSPNLLLPTVVFIALHLPRQSAVLGAFFAGLMQDLSSMQPPGIYAVSYGVSAVLITRAADGVRRGHVLTWVSMTLLTGVICGSVILLHDVLRSSVDGVRVGPRTVLVSVLFSTLISPPVIWVLRAVYKWIGPDPGRRGHRV